MHENLPTTDQTLRILILTDGKMGDLAQCRGVAQAVGADVREVKVQPGKLAAIIGRLGRDKNFSDAVDAITIPPDIILASGRRTVPYLRAAKALFGPKTLSVFLKDPRTGAQIADFLWVPSHDSLRGPNVLHTPTAPHSHTVASQMRAAKALRARLPTLPRPWLGVLLGGATRAVPYEPDTVERLQQALHQAAQSAGSVLVTASRRTPVGLVQGLTSLHPKLWLWDEQGENPYAGMLGACDAFFVTGDSHNMVSEALSAGRHTMVFRPAGLPTKFAGFLDTMERQKLITPPQAPDFARRQTPVDATPQIAQAMHAALDALRSA